MSIFISLFNILLPCFTKKFLKNITPMLNIIPIPINTIIKSAPLRIKVKAVAVEAPMPRPLNAKTCRASCVPKEPGKGIIAAKQEKAKRDMEDIIPIFFPRNITKSHTLIKFAIPNKADIVNAFIER